MIEPEELAPGIGALERALREDGVRLVCLFGSLAEGQPGRDVDLAVLFHDYDFDRYIEFLELARRTLEADAVDVTVLNRASASTLLKPFRPTWTRGNYACITCASLWNRYWTSVGISWL